MPYHSSELACLHTPLSPRMATTLEQLEGIGFKHQLIAKLEQSERKLQSAKLCSLAQGKGAFPVKRRACIGRAKDAHTRTCRNVKNVQLGDTSSSTGAAEAHAWQNSAETIQGVDVPFGAHEKEAAEGEEEQSPSIALSPLSLALTKSQLLLTEFASMDLEDVSLDAAPPPVLTNTISDGSLAELRIETPSAEITERLNSLTRLLQESEENGCKELTELLEMRCADSGCSSEATCSPVGTDTETLLHDAGFTGPASLDDCSSFCSVSTSTSPVPSTCAHIQATAGPQRVSEPGIKQYFSGRVVDPIAAAGVPEHSATVRHKVVQMPTQRLVAHPCQMPRGGPFPGPNTGYHNGICIPIVNQPSAPHGPKLAVCTTVAVTTIHQFVTIFDAPPTQALYHL